MFWTLIFSLQIKFDTFCSVISSSWNNGVISWNFCIFAIGSMFRLFIFVSLKFFNRSSFFLYQLVIWIKFIFYLLFWSKLNLWLSSPLIEFNMLLVKIYSFPRLYTSNARNMIEFHLNFIVYSLYTFVSLLLENWKLCTYSYQTGIFKKFVKFLLLFCFYCVVKFGGY